MSITPTVKKIVTRPVIKLEKEKPVFVRLSTAMYQGPLPKQRAGTLRAPVAPTFVDVINLDDGSDATLPIHAKLKEVFDRSYPHDAYVGKCFSITAKTRQAGRQFSPFYLAEIEDPNPIPATPPEPTPEPASPPAQLHRSAGRR